MSASPALDEGVEGGAKEVTPAGDRAVRLSGFGVFALGGDDARAGGRGEFLDGDVPHGLSLLRAGFGDSEVFSAQLGVVLGKNHDQRAVRNALRELGVLD